MVAKVTAVDVEVRYIDRTRDVRLVLLEPFECRGELGAATANRLEFDQVAGQERVHTLHGGVAVDNRDLVNRPLVKRRLRFGTSSVEGIKVDR